MHHMTVYRLIKTGLITHTRLGKRGKILIPRDYAEIMLKVRKP